MCCTYLKTCASRRSIFCARAAVGPKIGHGTTKFVAGCPPLGGRYVFCPFFPPFLSLYPSPLLSNLMVPQRPTTTDLSRVCPEIYKETFLSCCPVKHGQATFSPPCLVFPTFLFLFFPGAPFLFCLLSLPFPLFRPLHLFFEETAQVRQTPQKEKGRKCTFQCGILEMRE